MKQFKKITFIFLFIVSIANTTLFAAMTPATTYGAKFSRGVSNCCYYIGNTAKVYTAQINAAADNWVDTGYGWNPIYMTPVSSNYATHMDFYGRTPANNSYLDSSTLGYTTYWNTDGTKAVSSGGDPLYDYFYSEIYFNLELSDSYDYRTAKHEMGHAFGIAHTTNHYSIMYPSIGGTYVTTVQECDHNTINYLYN